MLYFPFTACLLNSKWKHMWVRWAAGGLTYLDFGFGLGLHRVEAPWDCTTWTDVELSAATHISPLHLHLQRLCWNGRQPYLMLPIEQPYLMVAIKQKGYNLPNLVSFTAILTECSTMEHILYIYPNSVSSCRRKVMNMYMDAVHRV